MDEARARDVIERFWKAASERDFDAAGDFFTENVTIEWPQSGERVRGKEACINVFMNYPGGMPRLLGVRRVMGSGDFWLAETELDYPGQQRVITVSAFVLNQEGKISQEVDWFAEPFPAPEWRRQWVEQ